MSPPVRGRGRRWRLGGLFGLALCVALPAAAKTPKWGRMTPQEQSRALETVAQAPIDERLVALSAQFLGARYVVSPLGEGSGPDPDPLFRADAADCLTFVEQSLALAYSHTPEDVLPELNRLRYSDEGLSYATRLHLMEAQWLPTQVARGHLREVTAELFGDTVERTEHVLTPTTWTSRSSRALQLPKERQLEGSFPLELLPLSLARERVDAFPHGSILLVVREARPLIATRITHLGIVVHRNGRTFLRHASRSGPGQVVDEDLLTFLTRNAGYRRWPVDGVSVFEPLERERPRVARTGPGTRPAGPEPSAAIAADPGP